MRNRLAGAAILAAALLVATAGIVSAAPDNGKTLHFVLTCDDGNVYDASFNGGPSAFHLDTGGMDPASNDPDTALASPRRP